MIEKNECFELNFELNYSDNLKSQLDIFDNELRKLFYDSDKPQPDIEAVLDKIIEAAFLQGYEAGFKDGLNEEI